MDCEGFSIRHERCFIGGKARKGEGAPRAGFVCIRKDSGVARV